MNKRKASNEHNFANNTGEGGAQSSMPIFWFP
jgi:hypothetical protein